MRKKVEVGTRDVVEERGVPVFSMVFPVFFFEEGSLSC